MGLPGQTVQSVTETVRAVAEAGGVPYLAEYSPIPHTALWAKAVSASEYDIARDPIFHNNSLLPCWDEDQRKQVPALRRLVATIRREAGNLPPRDDPASGRRFITAAAYPHQSRCQC